MSEAEAGLGKKIKKAFKKVKNAAKKIHNVVRAVDCATNPVPGSCPIG